MTCPMSLSGAVFMMACRSFWLRRNARTHSMLIEDAPQLDNRGRGHDTVLDDDDRKPAAPVIRGEYERLCVVIVVDVEVVVLEVAGGEISPDAVCEAAPIGAVNLDVA